jgi:hypothetical protein
MANGASTGDLFVVGCSIENQKYNGIAVTKVGQGTFFNIVVSGNEFAWIPIPILVTTPGDIWVSGLTVSGNTIALSPTGGCAISINGVMGPTVTGNSIRGTGGTSYGVALGVQTIWGRVGMNAGPGLSISCINNGINNTISN